MPPFTWMFASMDTIHGPSSPCPWSRTIENSQAKCLMSRIWWKFSTAGYCSLSNLHFLAPTRPQNPLTNSSKLSTLLQPAQTPCYAWCFCSRNLEGYNRVSPNPSPQRYEPHWECFQVVRVDWRWCLSLQLWQSWILSWGAAPIIVAIGSLGSMAWKGTIRKKTFVTGCCTVKSLGHSWCQKESHENHAHKWSYFTTGTYIIVNKCMTIVNCLARLGGGYMAQAWPNSGLGQTQCNPGGCYHSCDLSPKHHKTNISICLRARVKRWSCRQMQMVSQTCPMAPCSGIRWWRRERKGRCLICANPPRRLQSMTLRWCGRYQQFCCRLEPNSWPSNWSCRCCGKCRSREYKWQAKREGHLEMRLIA